MIFSQLADIIGIPEQQIGEALGSGWWLEKMDVEPEIEVLVRGIEGWEKTPVVGITIDDVPLKIEVGKVGATWGLASYTHALTVLRSISGMEPNPLEELKLAVRASEIAFLADLRECIYCKKTFPPYEMDDGGYCYGCGSEVLGNID